MLNEAIDAIIPADASEYAKQTVVVLDLLGTFVFALSGGAVGVRQRLDLFGIFVVAFAAGNLGGVLRDLLIGSIPPAAIEDWRYAAASLLAGVFAFLWYPAIRKMHAHILVLDAAGLALFAVAGTEKALVFGMNPVIAPLLGMLTGIGGGIVRDVLIGEVPWVLRSELYAVAAFAGALVIVIGHMLGLEPVLTAVAGAVLCFGLRFLAIRRGWSLPVPKSRAVTEINNEERSDD
jgi:uncharacterized membrane protein YeiH